MCHGSWWGLWVVTFAGIAALLPYRQLNYAMGGPPFSVQLDFQVYIPDLRRIPGRHAPPRGPQFLLPQRQIP
jgi:hypothetical protein